jgi:hypothetical protein
LYQASAAPRSLVAKQDLAVFTAALEWLDEEAAKAVVGNAWKLNRQHQM